MPDYLGTFFRDNAGELINPSQFIQGKDGYTKTSNELRFSTSAENRWRFSRRSVNAAPDARHPAGIHHHRTGGRRRCDRLGRHLLAHQSGVWTATRRSMAKSRSMPPTSCRYRRRDDISKRRIRWKGSSASASPTRTIRARANKPAARKRRFRNRALRQPQQDREAERQHVPLQRHVPRNRRRDVLRHVVRRSPTWRRQSAAAPSRPTSRTS